MKKRMILFVFVLCAVFLSAVSAFAAKDPAEVTFDELMLANDIRSLSNAHDALVYTSHTDFPDGSVNDTKAEFIFYDGRIWFDNTADFGEYGFSCLYAFDDLDPLAEMYTALNDGTKALDLFPRELYIKHLASFWKVPSQERYGTPPEIINARTEDGLSVFEIEFLQTYEESDFSYSWKEILYTDPETLLIQSMETVYSGETEAESYTVYTDVLYDEPYVPEGTAQAMVFGAEESPRCELTVVLDPGTDREYTETYSISKDTLVYFNGPDGYVMYADAGLSEVIDQPDLSGDKAVVYVTSE